MVVAEAFIEAVGDFIGAEVAFAAVVVEEVEVDSAAAVEEDIIRIIKRWRVIDDCGVE